MTELRRAHRIRLLRCVSTLVDMNSEASGREGQVAKQTCVPACMNGKYPSALGASKASPASCLVGYGAGLRIRGLEARVLPGVLSTILGQCLSWGSSGSIRGKAERGNLRRENALWVPVVACRPRALGWFVSLRRTPIDRNRAETRTKESCPPWDPRRRPAMAGTEEGHHLRRGARGD